MSTKISEFEDVTGVGSDFETGTLCGNSMLETFNGTPKCFTITATRCPDYTVNAQIVMPKYQALVVASQIAHQFGFKVVKDDQASS